MYTRLCPILKQALVQESPKNKKITIAIKHPSPILFAIVLPPLVAVLGAPYGPDA